MRRRIISSCAEPLPIPMPIRRMSTPSAIHKQVRIRRTRFSSVSSRAAHGQVAGQPVQHEVPWQQAEVADALAAGSVMVCFSAYSLPDRASRDKPTP